MEENQKNFKNCDLCKSQATTLCFDCPYNYYFCDSCYKYTHDKKENSNHKKENIDYILTIDTRCAEHPKNPLNLFCLDEKGNKINYLIFNININSTLLFNVLFQKSS